MFKRKYQRLIDQIYLKPCKKHPEVTNVTLDGNKMNTLAYYSSNYPEKVSKLATYLHRKISRQVKNKRYDCVDVSLQALDILLTSSPANVYSVYAEHFLVLAASMLETDDLIIQQVVTRSMVKFAKIKEETSLYYGPYEPLIVKYSAMCKEKDNQTKLVGSQGLHAIVNKISLEELAENIWQPVYMDRIISALLCCMTQYRMSPSEESMNLEICGEEAEQCMSLLMSTASFGQVASVLNSVYNYLDDSNLWGETLFVDYVYHLIMNSIQSRYWSAIVINGISRLQQQVNAPVSTKRNQLKVFCTMIGLMKNQALGSLTFDYLNFLFTEIPRITDKTADTQQLLYTQDLMDCLESVSTCLAEYETLEVMVFIVHKILETKSSTQLRDIMFRCLYTVTLNYKNRFPLAMFKPLLQLMQEPSTTVMGQAVFHTLLDLHGNLATINEPTYDLKLRNMPFCRPNEHFVRTHDLEIYRVLLKTLSFDTITIAHVKSLYKTLAVMATYQDPNNVVRFFTCLLLIQDMVVPERLTPHNRVQLLVATLSLLISAAEVTALPDLVNYGRQLADHRRNNADFGLSHNRFKFGEHFAKCCLIDDKIVSEQMVDQSEDNLLQVGILREISGLRELLLSGSTFKDRESTASGITDSKTHSSARLFDDGSLITNEGKPLPENLSFEAMKAVLTEPIEETKRKLALKRAETQRKFETCSFQDIMNGLSNEEEDKMRQTTYDIIHSETVIDPNQKPIQQILEERFPDIFR